MMKEQIKRILNWDRVNYEGVPLPPVAHRPGGVWFESDGDYVRSAEAEVGRLQSQFGLASDTSLLEVGCGPGRLAIGLLRVFTTGRLPEYIGFDVRRDYVSWCRRHLSRRSHRLKFMHVDMQNERYNPCGASHTEVGVLPVEDGSIDLGYLYSVFSHMREPDIRFYLREYARMLTPTGQVFCTAFLADQRDPVMVNPDMEGLRAKGPLHIVQYSAKHFIGICEAEGFGVELLGQATETDGQSALKLTIEAAAKPTKEGA